MIKRTANTHAHTSETLLPNQSPPSPTPQWRAIKAPSWREFTETWPDELEQQASVSQTPLPPPSTPPPSCRILQPLSPSSAWRRWGWCCCRRRCWRWTRRRGDAAGRHRRRGRRGRSVVSAATWRRVVRGGAGGGDGGGGGGGGGGSVQLDGGAHAEDRGDDVDAATALQALNLRQQSCGLLQSVLHNR